MLIPPYRARHLRVEHRAQVPKATPGNAVSYSIHIRIGVCPESCTKHADYRIQAMTAALGASPCSIGASCIEGGGPFSGTSLGLACRRRPQSRPQRASEHCRICAAAFRPCIDIHQAGSSSHAAYSLQKGLCREPDSMHTAYALQVPAETDIEVAMYAYCRVV